ncbi:MAG: ABC transporter substrate-binding protein [Gemmataceae bacterium]|nr:ABC transporter substrate-binding protein [Gemmataceae bacterium]
MHKTWTLILLAFLAGGLTAQEKSTTPDLLGYWFDASPPSAPAAELLRELSICCDEVILKDRRSLRVRPLQGFPGRPKAFVKALTVHDLAKPEESLLLPGDDVQEIRYWEEIALERIQLWRENSNAHSLGDKLRAMEEVLLALARFHRSWRSAAPLGVNPWQDLEAVVAKGLMQAQLDSLTERAKAASSDDERAAVLKRVASLLKTQRESALVRERVSALLEDIGARLAKDEQWSKLPPLLWILDQHLPQAPAAEALRKALKNRALALLQQAQNAPETSGVALLEEAYALWPKLPGLGAELARRKNTYKVLYIAVRELPQNLSPATARSDAERYVLDLLFERLVIPEERTALGRSYRPGLAHWGALSAARLPLRLRPDAWWSDGARVTALDLRHNALLEKQAGTFRWRELLETPQIDSNPLRMSVGFRQGVPDPLAPFAFFLLPHQQRGKPLASVDDAEFAKNPVGSGPFVYAGQKQEHGRTYALFTLNPNFEGRMNASFPALREVRLFAWKDALRDFHEPKPHMVFNVPLAQAEAVQKGGDLELRVVNARRVYFLAVNHRKATLASADLRRALAHAIDRRRLLQEHFGGDKQAAILSSPFPVKSWAVSPPPRVPEDPLQPELAVSLAKKAVKTLGKIRVTLKYPNNDPAVVAACSGLAQQVTQISAEADGGLEIQLVPLPPAQMRQAIHDRDFDLAYHHFDFPDDYFSLWPLFDPHPEALRPGGSNFLGYENDAALQSLLRAALSHRQFSAVRDVQHSIHAHLYERMPLIPLWQLPARFAVAPSLSPGPIDPLAPFVDLRAWKGLGLFQ